MLSALNIILFLSYTLASVGSMLIIKAWLPAVETQWAMKATLWGAPLIWAVFGLLLYGGSFAIWIAILARNELTVAYPLAIGLTLAVSTLTATIVLGETISLQRALGMILIATGIIFVAR